MNMVSYEWGKVPPPTKEQIEEMDALALRPDSEIDFSDIPRITDEQWANSKRHNRFITIPRLDPDILAWLQNQEPESANSVLREAMQRQLQNT